MKHKQFNLFVITEALKGILRVPIHSFISSDYDTAKLYFDTWLEGKKVKSKFQLYKIGEIDKELKIKEVRVFVTTGQDIKETKSFQRTLLDEKKNIEEAAKLRRQDEIVKKLFYGREIC